MWWTGQESGVANASTNGKFKCHHWKTTVQTLVCHIMAPHSQWLLPRALVTLPQNSWSVFCKNPMTSLFCIRFYLRTFSLPFSHLGKTKDAAFLSYFPFTINLHPRCTIAVTLRLSNLFWHLVCFLTEVWRVCANRGLSLELTAHYSLRID